MTKILATIGPVSERAKDLKKIIKFTNLLRINGSHNTLNWHHKVSKNIKKIDNSCKILIDFPGIKPRTLNNKTISIKKNQKVTFIYKKNNKISKNLSNSKNIFISKPFPKILKTNFFSISDGRYSFKFISFFKNKLVGIARDSFNLLPQKGLNIPGSVYNNNYQSKIYLKFLEEILKKKIKFDAIGLSYIQDEKIIKKIKKIIPSKIIVSKIENSEGCRNLEKIVKFSDAVMIDRGDLSAELGNEQLYFQIKEIIRICRHYAKPIIMATENLESLTINNYPSKGDLVSLGYSIEEKIDQIMLSDETATSKKFIFIIKWLYKFLIKKNILFEKKIFKKNNLILNNSFLDKFFSSLKSHQDQIVVFTRKGYIVDQILKLLPGIKIFIFTDNKKIHLLSSFRKNCISFLTNKFQRNMSDFIYKNIKKNKDIIFKYNLNCYLTYVSFARNKSRANTITKISSIDF